MILSGCEGGLGRGMIGSAGAAGGGGHGGRGGKGYYKGHSADGGAIYGNHKLPCEFGSGSGNASFGDSTTGGGIIGLLHAAHHHSHQLILLLKNPNISCFLGHATAMNPMKLLLN